MEVSLSNKFASLADQLSDLSSKLSHGAQESNIEMTGDDLPLSQESSSLSVESIASMTASIFSEEKEKDKRKMNLIVHNYPEPTSSEAQARKKEDIENISTLLNQFVNVPATITDASRLGKRSEGPRLTKITVSTIEEKSSILRNRRNLRNKSHPSHVQKVFITPDLTPSQQRKNKQLRVELAELNKSGNRYRIKNGKIILRESTTPPN